MGIASAVLARINRYRAGAGFEKFTPAAAKGGKIDAAVLNGHAHAIVRERLRTAFPRMTVQSKELTVKAWEKIFSLPPKPATK